MRFVKLLALCRADNQNISSTPAPILPLEVTYSIYYIPRDVGAGGRRGKRRDRRDSKVTLHSFQFLKPGKESNWSEKGGRYNKNKYKDDRP